MFFYRKQVVLVSLFLLLFLLGGLVIVSKNMEQITQREEQDLIFLAAKEKGLWELRFLGSSLEIGKKTMNGQKVKDYIQKLLWSVRNRQEN